MALGEKVFGAQIGYGIGERRIVLLNTEISPSRIEPLGRSTHPEHEQLVAARAGEPAAFEQSVPQQLSLPVTDAGIEDEPLGRAGRANDDL